MRINELMDDKGIERALVRMSHEIAERNQGVEDVVLMGIIRRGVPMAGIIAQNLQRFEGKRVPVGLLDITIHRDDINEEKRKNHTSTSTFPCDITGKNVVIVDDVMYTGRTARAAMEAIIHAGRPKSIQLAVLIDRGHRELPIRPDYVGKNVPTRKEEEIEVSLIPIDTLNKVILKG